MESKVKKSNRYIYRIMVEDMFGRLYNTALTLSYSSAVAYCKGIQRVSHSQVKFRVLRHSYNGLGFFDYFEFADFTEPCLNSLNKLCIYEKGKSCKNLECD